MAGATIHVTDTDFESKVLQGQGPVLVDFWAEWCGPCRMVGPILDEIATEMKGRLTVAKVNVDESPETPGRFGIRGIPTLILFKDGKAAATKVGAMPKQQLVAWLESQI